MLSSKNTFLVREGMRMVLKYGTGHKFAKLSRWAAGKTGTSNMSVDNWFNGFTTDLNATVWVGSDENHAIIGKFDGSRLALPIWALFMEKAIRYKKPSDFIVPKGVVSMVVNPKFGNLSDDFGIKMWFDAKNVPQELGNALDVLHERRSLRNPFANTSEVLESTTLK